MSRAVIVRALAVAALGGILILRSSSRGDEPSKLAKATTESPAKKPAAKIAKSTEPQTTKPQTTGQPAQTAVDRALAETAEFNFADTSLKDLAEQIADRYKINVILDTKSLTDAGVTPDTTITEHVKGVTLRSALHLALQNKDLDFFGDDDNVLLITTGDVAKTRTVVRIYDVRKFVDPPVEFATGPESWSQLSQVVTSAVAPQTWDANGGSGTLEFADGNMIVEQTEEIHSQIDDLLTQLETAHALAASAKDTEIPADLSSTKPPDSPIEQALDSRQDFIFTDIPLGDVAQMLEKKLGVSVQLDTKALADAGVTRDTPLSLKLKQVRARVGLHNLLATKDLDFIIDHEVLLITTSDVSKSKTVTRLYPVKDLVGQADEESSGMTYEGLVSAVTGSVAPASWDINGGAGSAMAFPICKILVVSQTQRLHQDVKQLLTALRAAKRSNPRAPAPSSNAPVVRIYSLASAIRSTATSADKQGEQIVEMIRKLIEPKSWSDPNAYIGLAADSIVVRQTPQVHRHIQNLIDAFEAVPTSKSGTGAQPTVPVRGGGFGGGAF